MTWKYKLMKYYRQKLRLVFIWLPCTTLIGLYLISWSDFKIGNLRSTSVKTFDDHDERVDGFLVWSSKCHMPARNPFDPSITDFVEKIEFEPCTTSPLLTKIIRESNGSSVLAMDHELAKTYRDLVCCWAIVRRPKPTIPVTRNIDSNISVEACVNFEEKVVIPSNVDIVLVKCKANRTRKTAETKAKPKAVEEYANIHPIMDLEKVRDRLDRVRNFANESRKLSVLMLGIDNMSRLNFQRTLPKTRGLLEETGWIGLNGYNKIGENTFPNLMAILTGQTPQQSFAKCDPTVSYGLDNCPMLWYKFRNASYATAFGEDEVFISTFNFNKFGFIEPPTDYYLRPYVMAAEKLLTIKKKFRRKYCTGPQLSFDRVFDYGVEFAQNLIGVPHFGLFWSNSISHETINGPSSIDDRMLAKLKVLERSGVLNDSMVIFLSDHGMRYDMIRETIIGWYEERLPFIYIWLPQWFREQNYEAYRALRVNSNRLTSPYDLYETLRDVLTRAGGQANSSPGCSTCRTLFQPVPRDRSCEEAGVPSHWCTCMNFKSLNTDDRIALLGVQKFLDHVENIIKKYKDSNGKRLCAKLKLKKLFRVDQVLGVSNDITSSIVEYLLLLQVTPGDGKFEATVRYHENGTFFISDYDINRINSYAKGAYCLHCGFRQYCQCIQ